MLADYTVSAAAEAEEKWPTTAAGPGLQDTMMPPLEPTTFTLGACPLTRFMTAWPEQTDRFSRWGLHAESWTVKHSVVTQLPLSFMRQYGLLVGRLQGRLFSYQMYSDPTAL